jgi:ankyrin repeat protein
MELRDLGRGVGQALLGLSIACAGVQPARAQVATQSVEPARAAIRLKNYAEAIARLQPLTERGDPQAQYLLGSLHRAGLGAGEDQARGRALLLAAAQSNHAAAAYSLAMMYANEEPRDVSQARTWLKRAAEAGHPLAQAAMQRGALPLEFLPQKDLNGADARAAALWLAAQHDDAELVAALADAETLERTDDFGRGALAIAAQSGAAHAMESLLERGASPSQADAFGITPLMLAARSGNEAVVDALLRAQAPRDVVDRVGNSALMHAAASGSAPTVQRLLHAGANAALLNAQGWSALDCAIQADSQSVAELLRQQGLTTRRKPQRIAGSPSIPLQRAGNSAADLYKGMTDLQVAASRSSPALLQEVIRRDRETGRATPLPDGLLLAAAVTGSPATVEAAFAAGARVGKTSSDPLPWLAMRGESDALATVLAHRSAVPDGPVAPLLIAVTARRAQTVRALLDAHADTEVRDDEGRTPLMIAAAAGQEDIAGLLLSHLARMDPVDKLGRTALWYASAAGSANIAAALLAQKGVLDVADQFGLTALGIASARGRDGIVDTLLKAGADVNAATRNGSTPLMLATQGGHSATIARLLSAGARVDGQNRYGDTALILAVRAGQSDTVRQLLAAGASTKLRNTDRVSALDVAGSLALAPIAALLEQN